MNNNNEENERFKKMIFEIIQDDINSLEKWLVKRFYFYDDGDTPMQYLEKSLTITLSQLVNKEYHKDIIENFRYTVTSLMYDLEITNKANSVNALYILTYFNETPMETLKINFIVGYGRLNSPHGCGGDDSALVSYQRQQQDLNMKRHRNMIVHN